MAQEEAGDLAKEDTLSSATKHSKLWIRYNEEEQEGSGEVNCVTWSGHLWGKRFFLNVIQ